jgi:hypothetical protein
MKLAFLKESLEFLKLYQVSANTLALKQYFEVFQVFSLYFDGIRVDAELFFDV